MMRKIATPLGVQTLNMYIDNNTKREKRIR